MSAGHASLRYKTDTATPVDSCRLGHPRQLASVAKPDYPLTTSMKLRLSSLFLTIGWSMQLATAGEPSPCETAEATKHGFYGPSVHKSMTLTRRNDCRRVPGCKRYLSRPALHVVFYTYTHTYTQHSQVLRPASRARSSPSLSLSVLAISSCSSYFELYGLQQVEATRIFNLEV